MLESTTRLVGDQYIQYAAAEKSFERAYCFIAKFIAAKVSCNGRNEQQEGQHMNLGLLDLEDQMCYIA